MAKICWYFGTKSAENPWSNEKRIATDHGFVDPTKLLHK